MSDHRPSIIPLPGPSSSQSGPKTASDEQTSDSVYYLKWIPWNTGKIPIVMQSKNGPCPLIATMNVLSLRERIRLSDMLEQITSDQLLSYLADCLMDCVQATDVKVDETDLLNLEQHVHDAIEVLPKLKTGLDVNIRFTGITDFEYTPESVIFDLLRIPLFHGWICDPELAELCRALGDQSYNQLVDNIITNKNSSDPEMMTQIMIAEEFLENTASQLTNYGLMQLVEMIKDNEIGILFRNNHFLTIFKREQTIYTLVTDTGYLTEDTIVWEALDNIEGAGRFYDSSFNPSELSTKNQAKWKSEMDTIKEREIQLEQDFQMALRLKEEEESDVI